MESLGFELTFDISGGIGTSRIFALSRSPIRAKKVLVPLDWGGPWESAAGGTDDPSSELMSCGVRS